MPGGRTYRYSQTFSAFTRWNIENTALKLGTSLGVNPSSNNTIVRLALVYGIQ